MSDRALGLGLVTLGALMEAGVPAADAAAAAAQRLPAGAARASLIQAVARLRDGVAPEVALAEAIPALTGLRGGKGLAERVRAEGRDRLQAWRVARRLAIASRYPVAMALALVGVVGALVFFTPLRDEGAFSTVGANGAAALAVVFALTAALLGWTLLRRHRDPLWTRALPGGRLWRLTRSAQIVRDYAAARDPRRGAMSPQAALGVDDAAPLARALRARLGPLEAAELMLGEAAHRPVDAADGLAARLEAQAAEAADRLVAATGVALLVVVALGLLLLAMSRYSGLGALTALS